MPFDSNGTFNRVIPGGWQADAAANIKITALRHDNEDDGFATGLSTCITKDGRTQPTANIPMNNKKLVNLGEPTGPSDAATKNYVDTFKAFTAGINISGAGPINGFLNFTSPTGVNGIGWTTADMSWVGRLEEAGKTSKRLAVNNTKDGTGTDLVSIDEGGRFNSSSGQLTHNLSYEGTTWRTISPGWGTLLQFGSGVFRAYSNDVATATNPYLAVTPREFFNVHNSGGNSIVSVVKSASAKASRLQGMVGTSVRWILDLGNPTAESATRGGSDFHILSYDNTGANGFSELVINRATHEANFGGSIKAAGSVTSGSNFDSTSTTCILSATNPGSIYLRPNGPTANTTGVSIGSDGTMYICESIAAASGGLRAGRGLQGKSGYQGAYGGNWHNLQYVGGFEYVWVDATNMGAITWQSDYRIKKNVKPLPSMWDNIKALRPVRYEHRKFKNLFENETTERWGLVAHEVQQALTKTAAFGEKDEDNVLQSLNPLVLIAVLTKGLQEAMARIETLEARAATA